MTRMRHSLVIGIAVFACAGTQAGEADDQMPPIGIIDFHGLRSYSVDEVRKLLPFVEGDRIELKPGYDDGSAVARALGVPQVNLEFVCCTPEQKVIAFVGVAETAPPPRPEAPKGPERLPETIMRTHDGSFAGSLS